MDIFIEEIKELEELFSENNYDGSGREAFVIEEGNIPIMISAPHAVNQYREGKVKWADMYTGGIARYLHKVTGCHLIYSCKYTESDPNYDPPSINMYQNELKKYLEKHKVFFLIDLHGVSKEREYAVEMGTAPVQNNVPGVIYEEDPSLHEYKAISSMIKTVLEERFKNCHSDRKEVWKNIIFDAGDQNTVTKYISENTSVPCVQLEINRIYRDPQNEVEIEALIKGLIELIHLLETFEWNESREI